MKKYTRLYALILLIFTSINLLYSQYNHDKINFTIEDGLPSNECHDVVQDSSGYIWIATDRGLSRFDGYAFRNYGLQDGLSDLVCLDLQLDSEQNIWINTLSKVLYKYIPQYDSIVEYEYNSIIQQYHNNISELSDFFIDTTGTVHISIGTIGVLVIHTNGSSDVVESGIDNICTFLYEFDEFHCVAVDNGDKNGLFYNSNFKGFLPGSGNWYKECPILFNNTFLEEELNVDWDFERKRTIEKIGDSEFLYYWRGILYHIKNNHAKSSIKSRTPNDILFSSDSTIYIGYVYPLGLKKYKGLDALINNNYTSILDSVSISRIYVDDEKQMWISSLEQGIFLFQDNFFQPSKSILKNSRISELLSINNELYFNANEKNIGITDTLLQSYDILIESESNLFSIYFDDTKQRLIFGNSIINYVDINEIKKPNSSVFSKRALATKTILKLSNGDILTLYYNVISLYKNILDGAYYSSGTEHESMRFESVGQLNDSIVLIGGLHGIYTFNLLDKKLQEVDLHSSLKCRINDIQVSDDDFILFGTQGNGVILWDKKTEYKQVSTSDGLASNIIEKTYISEEGRIFTCSFAGLSEISLDDFDNYKITNYNRHNGLTTNEVLDVKVINDKIYVATGKGINLIAPNVKSEKSKEVKINEVSINSKKYAFKHVPNKLSYTEGNMTIYYKCIDVHKMGDILYRYRMNNQDWIETKLTYINFSSLSSGQYKFAIQVRDEFGKWSNSSEYAFTIGKPIWRRIEFILALITLSFLIGYLIFKNKVNQLKLENKLNEEIIALERSALQAQMNPHFIFNCLNSIQNFIMENKKEEAMNYLSDFSKLVRLNLQVSVDNRISIDTEVKLLESYLKLEKLRLKESFNYELKIDKEIQKLSTYIPPMLIQPYVENAVIHGMKHRDTGGIVKVTFQKQGKHLNILIFDNGKYSESSPKTEYKSLGMSITNKRLAYINQLDDIDYKVQPNVSDNGTTIHITIPFNQEK